MPILEVPPGNTGAKRNPPSCKDRRLETFVPPVVNSPSAAEADDVERPGVEFSILLLSVKN